MAMMPKVDCQQETCKFCQGAISGWLVHDAAGRVVVDWGWAHHVHPDDDHEAEPLENKNSKKKEKDNG